MYALLVPVARGSALPPDRFAGRILRRDPSPVSIPGVIVQLAFGAFWGLMFGLAAQRGFAPGGSYPALGLVTGFVAFASSLVGFWSLGLVRSPVDFREWSGHFLNHLVFGAILGLVFLSFQGI